MDKHTFKVTGLVYRNSKGKEYEVVAISYINFKGVKKWQALVKVPAFGKLPEYITPLTMTGKSNNVVAI